MASAGGTDVKIWDIVGGGRLVQTLGSHQKTVTSLTITAPRESSSALEQDAPRLLTSSLDGHVRVFDLSKFKVHSSASSSYYVAMCLWYVELTSYQQILGNVWMVVSKVESGKGFALDVHKVLYAQRISMSGAYLGLFARGCVCLADL